MFNFPTNIRPPGFRVGVPDDVPGFRVGQPDEVPGFRVGLPDDGTDQNSQPGLLRVDQPVSGLDPNGLSGFRHGPPDKGPDRNTATDGLNGLTRTMATAVGAQTGAQLGGPPGAVIGAALGYLASLFATSPEARAAIRRGTTDLGNLVTDSHADPFL